MPTKAGTEVVVTEMHIKACSEVVTEMPTKVCTEVVAYMLIKYWSCDWFNRITINRGTEVVNCLLSLEGM